MVFTENATTSFVSSDIRRSWPSDTFHFCTKSVVPIRKKCPKKGDAYGSRGKCREYFGVFECPRRHSHECQTVVWTQSIKLRIIWTYCREDRPLPCNIFPAFLGGEGVETYWLIIQREDRVDPLKMSLCVSTPSPPTKPGKMLHGRGLSSLQYVQTILNFMDCVHTTVWHSWECLLGHSKTPKYSRHLPRLPYASPFFRALLTDRNSRFRRKRRCVAWPSSVSQIVRCFLSRSSAFLLN